MSKHKLDKILFVDVRTIRISVLYVKGILTTRCWVLCRCLSDVNPVYCRLKESMSVKNPKCVLTA